MVSKILAPLDCTEIAEAALDWAAHAAVRCGATIHLLTVVDPEQPDAATKLKEAESYLQSRRDHLRNKKLTVKMEVASGPPAETILERAEDADLTVVTSGTVRWLISAVLDRVLERMNRPLVVVRGGSGRSPDPPNFDKLLVAVDRTAYSSDILPVVTGLARSFNSAVVVCHAIPPNVDIYGQTIQTNHSGASAAIQEANLFVSRVGAELEQEGLTVETVVVVGDPPQQIVGAARRSGAGLIALTTRGREHLDSRLVGSVANAVLHSSRLPCLLTRAEVPAQPPARSRTAIR